MPSLDLEVTVLAGLGPIILKTYTQIYRLKFVAAVGYSNVDLIIVCTRKRILAGDLFVFRVALRSTV